MSICFKKVSQRKGLNWIVTISVTSYERSLKSDAYTNKQFLY